MSVKLVLIGGMPGSGKSYLGKEIVQHVGLFVDKDSVSRLFTERMLQLLGSNPDDRESSLYLDNVRDLEYQTMIKHALENIELGRSVVCSAPFIREFEDAQWLEDISLEAELFDADVIKIWIHVDLPTARERIIARGASRDSWKLANWDAYITTVPHAPPSNIDVIVIDNSHAPKTPIFEQIEAVIAQISEDDL